jgi:CRISPR-associated endonuclease/helicase Cas3
MEEKNQIWAKSSKRKDDSPVTLAEHTKDVADAFEAIKNKLPSEKLQKLIQLVIQCHDWGKVLPSFQIKSLKNNGYIPFDVYIDLPHSLFSTLLINRKTIKEMIGKIAGNKEYEKIVYPAIAYHHWRESFYDIIEGATLHFENLSTFLQSENGKKVVENLNDFLKEIKIPIDLLGPNIEWIEGLSNGVSFADYVTPPYQLYRLPQRLGLDNKMLKDWVLISGFTMISDHFASFKETEDHEISIDQIDIKGLGYDEIKRQISIELKEKIEKANKKYKPEEIWQFNKVEECKDQNTILVAPTGMGKTEFSYLWTNGDKFFYTLPLRAAVNQIYKRTESIFSKSKTGLLHSDADVFLYDDGGEQDKIKVYDLARQLAYPAIVSTGDQFFPYALRPPGFEKIFARFSYSRLIIDEVQAYDPKAAAIVVKFIEHVVGMGGKFLLMTATLPDFIKNRIKESCPAFKEIDIYQNYHEELKSLQKHVVEIKSIDNSVKDFTLKDDYFDDIIQKATEDDGKRVLVIMNTVKQAQTVFKELKKKTNFGVENLRLLHSRFSYHDRKKTEDALKNWFGNPKPDNEKIPKILVATQVVEASLDLDSDYMFTEIAPMDSLIQRMGRVLRSFRFDDKKKPVTKPNIFIFFFEKGYQSAGNKVYNNELIENTCNLIINPNLSEDDLQKWHEKKGKKKIDFINDFSKLKPNHISEFKKKELVEKLYNGLPSDSQYLKRFEEMLDILDAGFMSDRKSEAQRTFREINDVQVIPESRLSDLVNDLYDENQHFRFNTDKPYTKFKKLIINNYVVNVPRYAVEGLLYDTYKAFNKIMLEIEDAEMLIDQKDSSKLKNWFNGIYVLEVDYDDKNGLNYQSILQNKKSFEIFG